MFVSGTASLSTLIDVETMSLSLEIRSLDEQCSSLCLSLPGCKEEIVVSGQDNLVRSSFSELSMLYFTNIKLTPESIIGNLISSEEDCSHFCGSVFPLTVLSLLAERALQASSVKTFFQVAACLCKLVVQETPLTTQSIISSGKNVMRSSIELPANSIWSLLILSEVLGAEMVMVDCKQKLAKMLAAGKASDGSRLPPSVLDGIDAEFVKDIEAKLTAHLLMYGVGSPRKVSQEASPERTGQSVANKANKQPPPIKAMSDTSVTSGSNNTYQSTESSAFFSDDEDGNKTSHRPASTPRLNNTKPQVNNYQSPGGYTDSEHSFRDERHDEVPRIPAVHGHQFTRLRQSPGTVEEDDQSDISSIHSINSWSVHADESHHLKSSIRNTMSTRTNPGPARPQFSPPANFQDQPMRMSDISQHHHSPYQQVVSSQQHRPQTHQSHGLEDYPKTLWNSSSQVKQHLPQPNRSQSPDFRDPTRARSPGVQRSPSPRWNVSTRESRSPSPSALTASQSKHLAADDLKLSRDIAKLRLREVKIKSELEASKLSAEKALRDNKLKSLELKAAVLRMGSSGGNNFKSPRASSSSKPRPNSAPRPRTSLHQSIRIDAKARSLEREYEIAEEARIRALQRIKEKRREIADQEQRRLEEKHTKQAEMWKTRDEKIARFIDQQQRSPVQHTNSVDETKTSPALTTKVPFSNTAHRIASNNNNNNNNNNNVHASPRPTLSTSRPDTPKQSSPVEVNTDSLMSPYPGAYTKEALEAVGLGFSPTLIQQSQAAAPRSKTLEDVTFEQYRAARQPSSTSPSNQVPQLLDASLPRQSEPKRYQRAVEVPPPPPPKIIAPPPKQVDTIDFNIVRCWDLPECLGGTNPYVLLNIPSFGQARTACVFNSTQPYFGGILSLNYPKQAWKGEHGTDDLVNFDGIETSVVQIFVYNKNQSISDEMVAFGEHDLLSMVAVKHSLIVDLYDAHHNPAGYVEIAARYRD